VIMETRVCKICKTVKELNKDNFQPYTSSIGKKLFRLYCRECRNKKNRKHYWGNKDEISEKAKEYYKNNREKKLAKGREWYEKNKDARKASLKAYYEKVKDTDSFKKTQQEDNKRYREKNPDYGKKWYEENKGRHKASMKEFYKNNPGYNARVERERRKADPFYALKRKLRTRTSMAFEYRGWKKTSKTQKMLGCSWDTLKAHIEEQFIDGMSWENEGVWQVDHIIPLNASNNEEELNALLYYKNLQPLWSSDNIAKSDNHNPEDKRKYLEWYSANVKSLDL